MKQFSNLLIVCKMKTIITLLHYYINYQILFTDTSEIDFSDKLTT